MSPSETCKLPAGFGGSKKVISEKNKQRQVVIKMLKLLGRYVEVMSDNDPAIFNSSGFQAASTTKTPPQPLPVPTIRKVNHGLVGQLLVVVKGHRRPRVTICGMQ
jgi:hypothetical protein